ncbi:unnamed protein product [Durusdinium trenchii]|uniref:Uncharacterized protein n=2 Tax=Durusdinium trenchii TaxID=1381693 RepID=A0ABP0NVS9_9DINO
MAATSGPSLPDRVARAVIDRYDQLPGRGKPQGRAWTVLAGIVAERGRSLKVLALATGTRCIGVASMVARPLGHVLHDAHAEVLCRRAFQRWLVSEMLHSKEERKRSSFLKLVDEEDLQFSLDDDVHLHFYVSTLPCGECALVPLQSKLGTLARKLTETTESETLKDRNRTGAKPSRGMPNDPQAEGLEFHQEGILRYKSGRSDTRPESRSVCYSCSDKICRWNHIGWEGALLSRLLKRPLKMTSLIIGGSIYDQAFVHRALFGRAGVASAQLAPQFHPTTVEFGASREAAEADASSSKVSTGGLSLVWTEELEDSTSPKSAPGATYEVLIGHTGQRQGLRHDRKASRRARPAEAAKAAGDRAGAVDSWVSVLCKKLKAQDLLQSLRQLKHDEALQDWLLRPTLKRRRLDEAGHAAEGETGHAETARRAVATFPSYAWLKEMMTSDAYRASKKDFHSGDPFCHWWRKQSIEFENDLDGVDGFQVDLLAEIFTKNPDQAEVPL